MQKTKQEYDLPPSVERSPLVIACEQTGPQKVQMKMDELFNSSPRLPVFDEPALYASTETLQLKAKEKPAKSKRRLSTNSAAGRSKRLELEQSQKVKAIKAKSKTINPFSSQTMKLAFFTILASLFRT